MKKADLLLPAEEREARAIAIVNNQNPAHAARGTWCFTHDGDSLVCVERDRDEAQVDNVLRGVVAWLRGHFPSNLPNLADELEAVLNEEAHRA